MSIKLSVPSSTPAQDLRPKISIIGIGGAGGNAINNMIKSELEGTDFIVCNTDAQALVLSKAQHCIQLGERETAGLGAGSQPEVGRLAAEEAIAEVMEQIEDSHMVFIAAGMGGGTGTGAAPVIAREARARGILTVAVVTKPFSFEGSHRMKLAEEGIKELEKVVDTLIVIPNQNLFRIANEKTTFADAFNMADHVLYSGVRGITDLMVMPGLINLDFADVQSVMKDMGKAMMGTGEAEGERRALDAAEAAISNPLLDDSSMKGARGVLINITGGSDITLFEVDEAANRVREEVDSEAYIIIGSAFDTSLDGTMRVSVVATGIDANLIAEREPEILEVTEAAVATKSIPTYDIAPESQVEEKIQVHARGMEQPQMQPLMHSAPEQIIASKPVMERAPIVPREIAPENFIPTAPVKANDAPMVAKPVVAPAKSEERHTPKGVMGGIWKSLKFASEPNMEKTAADTRVAEVIKPTPASSVLDTRVMRQPDLRGLEVEESIGHGEVEGEQVNIPAFLRRQAS